MRRLSLLVVICSLAVSLISLTVLAFETNHVDASSTWTEEDSSAGRSSMASFSVDKLRGSIASSLSFTPAYTGYLPLIHTAPLDPDRIDMMYVTERDGVGWIYLADTELARSMPLTEGQAGSWSPDGNVLAYTRQINVDDGDIYLVNVDGTGQKALVTGETNDGLPVWSPDGNRLAFSRVSGDYFGDEIFVINSDGKGQTALGLEDTRESEPVWSPDGKKLLYLAESQNWPRRRLYSINADGSDRRLLAEDVNFPANHAWSPDGNKILFNRVANDSAEVFVMNADGSGQTNLTNSPALDWHAQWSPDGKRIVFSSNRNLQTWGTEEIFVMNSDGTNLIQLSHSQTSGAGWYPRWSPDGQKITYGASSGDSDWDVWIVAADGSGPEQPFVVSPGDDVIVVWSSDGQRVAFTSDRDGDQEIFTMNANGTGLKQLTHNQVSDFFFAWRP